MNSLWVKICGNTSLEDAQLAVDAGADAVGFVFAPSPRRVTAAQAAAIVPHLPAAVEKIGVFVGADAEGIEAAVREAGLTGVQLHFAADPELPEELHMRLGRELRVLRVLHFDVDHLAGIATQLADYAHDPHVDAVMVDSWSATAVGGTGVTFDWAAARLTLFDGAQHGSQNRLVAAGGLNPENVAEAISLLEPWGVDVVSGVEAAPGRKDPQKVADFVARARAASRK
ncbi:MAG: phosphoribosylanthranilate isomerase [Terracidiphilus sp.]|jgi:phosphoribosylanthranilate isomerase